MRKIKLVIIIMLFFCLFFTTYAETKKLKLNNKTIILDAGHGGIAKSENRRNGYLVSKYKNLRYLIKVFFFRKNT